MAKRSSLANPMRRKRHEIQKRLQKARASCIRSPSKRGYQRKRRTKPRNKWPNFRRGPGCVHHDAVDPRVTLCKVMAHSDRREGRTWTQADSSGRITGIVLTPSLKERQIPFDVSF